MQWVKVAFLICAALRLDAQNLLSPAEFFTQNYGKDFIPYHLKVAYFEHIAVHSELVKLYTYGFSVEKRPQIQAYISTKENLDRLEEIRINNLRRTGLVDGTPVDDGIAIIMLGYSVHGNEAAGSEAALSVLYALADAGNTTTKAWLRNVIVIIDLSLNPDGHARYTDWYTSTSNEILNVDEDSREHQEPWPGGRTNHYYFDLNRDWAWQTQIETQTRIKQYLQWMPHVHVDLHEMRVNSPYYFAPAAQPYHEYISTWQRDFQTAIGLNNARYFDKEGWLYFTKEVYDLFYPAYGDTYPTYSGAVGMTYEQGGSGRAGSAVLLDNGDTLTLQDRIDHHVTTSLSSIEMTSLHARELTEHFAEYYMVSRNRPPGKYRTYIISQDNNREKIQSLIRLLDLNAIEYGTIEKEQAVSGYHYATGSTIIKEIMPGDLVISALQPRSILTQVLFDPESKLVDSLTFDITSWSLPHVYGAEALATTSIIVVDKDFQLPLRETDLIANPFALFIPWQYTSSAHLLSQILKLGIKVRICPETIVNYGHTHLPGTFIITRADNGSKIDFDRKVIELAEKYGHSIFSTPTGFSSGGPDLGSNKLTLIKTPKILILGDEGVWSNSFGATWHYFEKVLEYPVSIVRVNDLHSIQLDKYNTLVMPSGNYPQLNESVLKKVSDWVSGGGKLIAAGGALKKLEGESGFSLTKYATAEEKQKAEELRKNEEKSRINRICGDRIRSSISDEVPGAIVKNKMDDSHPLAYGFSDYYFSLKTGSDIYQLQREAWNVVTVEKDAMVLGFAGNNVKNKLEGSVSFAVANKGRGTVIYMVDDPLFRGFWENGKFLFSNAIFMVGN